MDGIKWIKVTRENFDIYGVDDNFKRLPEDVAQSVSNSVATLMQYPAGGRVRFTTNSKRIFVKAQVKNAGNIGFDVYKMEYGSEIFVTGLMDVSGAKMVNGAYESREKEASLRNDGKTVSFTLNLPHSGIIDELEIGLDEDSVLTSGEKYINQKPVVFYGSSITHGYSASRPGMTYEAQISQKYNLNYTNLGFSGAAKGEQTMAEYISSLEMSAFVLDYDHNAYEEGQLEATHLPFYKTVREKNKDIPIIFVSRPDYNRSRNINEERAAVIYKTYEYAKKNGDDNVYFVHGKTLFSGDYYHNCTSDGCHPNDLGMYRMASVIGKAVAQALKLENKDKLHDYEMYI